MAEITLNGNPETIANPINMADFFITRNIPINRIAAELNGIIISSDKFQETEINDGDRLEVLRIVGGG